MKKPRTKKGEDGQFPPPSDPLLAIKIRPGTHLRPCNAPATASIAGTTLNSLPKCLSKSQIQVLKLHARLVEKMNDLEEGRKILESVAGKSTPL